MKHGTYWSRCRAESHARHPRVVCLGGWCRLLSHQVSKTIQGRENIKLPLIWCRVSLNPLLPIAVAYPTLVFFPSLLRPRYPVRPQPPRPVAFPRPASHRRDLKSNHARFRFRLAKEGGRRANNVIRRVCGCCSICHPPRWLWVRVVGSHSLSGGSVPRHC